MKVNYEEIGTFNPEKATRGLIDLYNKIKKENDQNNIETDKVKNQT